MEFSELLFDLYFLLTQIQGWGNDLSGLEFADERGHLDEGEVDRLRETERRLTQAQELAKARLAAVSYKHLRAPGTPEQPVCRPLLEKKMGSQNRRWSEHSASVESEAAH